MTKTVHIRYFALLREQSGKSEETLTTAANTVLDLYQTLKDRYQFTLGTDLLRVAMNNQFADWSTPLKSGDQIVFIPPVAGG